MQTTLTVARVTTFCGLSAARNAFNAFDKKSEERIKVGDIEATMKKLGHNIKSGWLEKIESTIDTEGWFDPDLSRCSVGYRRLANLPHSLGNRRHGLTGKSVDLYSAELSNSSLKNGTC